MEILSTDDIIAYTDENDYSKKQFIYVGVMEQTMKEIIETVRIEGRQSVIAEIFQKFDKYSCIKNDKWYLDYKKELQEIKEVKR